MLDTRRMSLLILACVCGSCLAGGTVEDYKRADGLQSRGQGLVINKQLKANWFADNEKFWFTRQLHDGKEFVIVDAEVGLMRPAFDHKRLAQSLSTTAEKEYLAEKLPFDSIDLADDCNSVEFDVGDSRYKCDLGTYECAKIDKAEKPKSQDRSSGRRSGGSRRGSDDGKRSSPDGKWEAFVKDHNLYLWSTGNHREFRLSHDGDPNQYYSQPSWSSDSTTLVAYKTTPGDGKLVYLIESSPKDGGRAKLQSHQYDLPGDKFTSYEMSVFDVRTKEQIRVDAEPIDFQGPPRLRWAEDCRRFTYHKTDRGHQRARVIRVNVRNGKVRTIIDEKSDTFINEWWDGGVGPRYIEDEPEIIWPSERHGYRHLYLYDSKTGKLKNRITRGRWVVRGYVDIDKDKRTIEFKASGRQKNRDPYLIHYYRINFDGTGLVCLTPGKGDHSAEFSPDRKYLIDTYSTVDKPAVHELRSAEDGQLICKLGEADASKLVETGWRTPEPFVAKGRDGVTDIYGIIHRPIGFDESKKYPVIEAIYAGPHGSFVPKSWNDYYSAQAIAELGFVVVQIDGMGTNNRSKAFHDVCWHNVGDAGFPDRMLWIKAAAERYPYMDITRVGVHGTSAGGQSSTGALLFHGDFYKVAVSACGCHDNRMDKASWNEQWMGYPVGPHYGEQSNITNAHKLTGKLLLILGELDRNVPPESTYRLVDALIKAKKEFEFVLLPGQGHTSGGDYGMRKRRDFFVKHLLGVDPPNWNAIDKQN